jgi:hypothetical protein
MVKGQSVHTSHFSSKRVAEEEYTKLLPPLSRKKMSFEKVVTCWSAVPFAASTTSQRMEIAKGLSRPDHQIDYHLNKTSTLVTEKVLFTNEVAWHSTCQLSRCKPIPSRIPAVRLLVDFKRGTGSADACAVMCQASFPSKSNPSSCFEAEGGFGSTAQ